TKKKSAKKEPEMFEKTLRETKNNEKTLNRAYAITNEFLNYLLQQSEEEKRVRGKCVWKDSKVYGAFIGCSIMTELSTQGTSNVNLFLVLYGPQKTQESAPRKKKGCDDLLSKCIVNMDHVDFAKDSSHAVKEILKAVLLCPSFGVISEERRDCIAFLKGWFFFVTAHPHRFSELLQPNKSLTSSAYEALIVHCYFKLNKDGNNSNHNNCNGRYNNNNKKKINIMALPKKHILCLPMLLVVSPQKIKTLIMILNVK
ncbi:hypothetical protein RFI_37689, partial [Reticulomyxa filosa]